MNTHDNYVKDFLEIAANLQQMLFINHSMQDYGK